jgi:molybdopterin molybdotransferase
VISSNLNGATEENPVELKVVGKLAAGDVANLKIAGGQAVRVTTGAPLPGGANAVLSEEFCEPSTDAIMAHHIAEKGRNVLERASDIRRAETVATKGEKLSPALIGLIASAGLHSAPVHKVPKVAVVMKWWLPENR